MEFSDSLSQSFSLADSPSKCRENFLLLFIIYVFIYLFIFFLLFQLVWLLGLGKSSTHGPNCPFRCRFRQTSCLFTGFQGDAGDHEWLLFSSSRFRSGGSLQIYFHVFNDLGKFIEDISSTSMSKTGYSSGLDLSRIPERWAK